MAGIPLEFPKKSFRLRPGRSPILRHLFLGVTSERETAIVPAVECRCCKSQNVLPLAPACALARVSARPGLHLPPGPPRARPSTQRRHFHPSK